MTEEKGQNAFPCPSCRSSLAYISRVKFTAHPAATFVEDTRQQEVSERGGSYSSRFGCPECGATLQALYQIKVLDVVQVASANIVAPPPPTPAELELAQLIEVSHGNGVLAAFAAAVLAQTVSGHPPANMETYFVSFLRTVQPKRIPPEALDYFRQRYGGWIDFWAAQRIGLVMVNGRPRRFVPMRCMNFSQGGCSFEVGGVAINRRAESFEFVRRTLVGYVPNDTPVFLEALKAFNGNGGRHMREVPLK